MAFVQSFEENSALDAKHTFTASPAASQRFSKYERRKRAVDVIIASSALIFLAPALLLVALAIKATSKGSVLFKQKRYGLNGRTFEIWKFRTMRQDSSNIGFKQAVKGDPRITRLGAFLRKTSVDELPQLVNVLRGDMSIVGPRPHAMEMDDELSGTLRRYRERFHVKPGITGLAQCKGFRGPTDTSKALYGRIARDRFYVQNRSIALDFIILVQTIRCVLKQDAF